MPKRLRPCIAEGVVVLLMLGQAVAALQGETTLSPWFARVWQSDEGLADNSVTGIAQTQEGYLWVSTHTSLSRFDGVRFQRVPVPTPPGRSASLIRAFLAERGQIWVGMEGGIAVALGRNSTNVFTTANGLPSFRPLAIAMDAERAVWIAYADGSACRIGSGEVTRYTARDGLGGSGACWIASDVSGQIWFAKAGKVGIFENGIFTNLFAFPERISRVATARKGGVWICAGSQVSYCPGKAQPAQTICNLPRTGVEPRIMFEDRSGALWVGTSTHGLFRWDGVKVQSIATSHREIECLAEDREQNLWVGTAGGGLNRLRPRVLEMQGLESGLPSETVRSVCEDASGEIWVVTGSGGLARFANGTWKPLTREEGWGEARATCVTPDGSAIWIGTQRFGLRKFEDGKFASFTRENGLAGDTVRSVMKDRAGNLWIGLESGYALQRMRGSEWKTYAQPPTSRTVRAMAEDTAGQVWLGTSDGFLLRVEGDGLVDETSRTLKVPKPIRALYAGEDGSLWIGYATAGLGRLHQGNFTLIGAEQGLADNSVCAMLPDSGGGLWFTSDHGLFQARLRELAAVVEGREKRLLSIPLGRDEGFPSLQGAYGYWPNSARSRDGRLLLAMRTGLAVVHPERMQPSRIPPPVQIERVIVDGRPIEPALESAVRVPPGARKIEIEFTGLSFVGPENMRFRHFLKGWDETWNDAGAQRVVSYSRLPPGRYDFQVTACNSVGIWSQLGATIQLQVQPFFWQTWAFRLILAGAVIAGGAIAARAYERKRIRRAVEQIERQRDIERERSRIARDIHDDLGAGLAQIGLLADLGAAQTAAGDGARAEFAKIADRARNAVDALEEIVWAANPRNDNLTRLADFLCQVADDCFESGPARCRKDVPTSLPEVPVRAEVRHNVVLAVKEALTNAIKHAKAQTVWLRLKWTSPELVIEVEDDGTGFDPAARASGRNGLGNQAGRMKDIGGSISIRSAPGQGTTVCFKVTLRDKMSDA